MNILITGTSKGIGKSVAQKFLDNGHFVYGFDLEKASISNENYKHFQLDIQDVSKYPILDKEIDILINNAGLQNSSNDINNNLVGTIQITEKYGIQKNIKSILFNISASAQTGFEFPEYVASKSGLVGYMKNVASRVAKEYKATCNSISLGGVLTDSNNAVINNLELWNKIMDVTPLKKWLTLDEVAEWFYFLTVINKSLTGQDILIDNGEKDLNNTFVWPYP
ncbi:MAG: SDR family oxidoreductase [Clostridia bacterium]|nr:SDR family oxidoreductase [Clostridia bacterium]